MCEAKAERLLWVSNPAADAVLHKYYCRMKKEVESHLEEKHERSAGAGLALLKTKTIDSRMHMKKTPVSKKCAGSSNKDFADIEKSLYENVK